jgi:hypothetical protein
MLANSIAEMRTYGEGFIIADQSPGLMDMSVIRNTNTKIILRLPDFSDRELVGLSASLSKEQIEELSKLEQGVAAVYQNDWVEPVLIKVNKCELVEKEYDASDPTGVKDMAKIKKQIVHLLIQGRVEELLDFDVDDIEKNLYSINISSRNREFIEEQVAEYKDDGKLDVWKDENLRKVSRHIVDMLGVRPQVENCAYTATSNTELTNNLAKIVKQLGLNESAQVALMLSQCFMKDLSIGQHEQEFRERIYRQWVEFTNEGGVK